MQNGSDLGLDLEQSLSSETASRKKDEKISALDDLFRATLAYRRSAAYFDLLKFISRFPKYAPFNCFLLHTQNPNITNVATPGQWWSRFERTIKPESRPLVILAPMGPVAFVYDMADTEGPELPPQLGKPFAVEGHVPESVWYYTQKNSEERDRIAIVGKDFSLFQAGRARTNNSGKVVAGEQRLPAKRVVELNSKHTNDEQYATVVHELAHIHCGHVGGDADGWWPDRRGLGPQIQEFEAESVSYIVCSRLRMKTKSAEYLAGYTGRNETIPAISLETVLKVAGYIESLGQKHLEPRKPKAKKAAGAKS